MRYCRPSSPAVYAARPSETVATLRSRRRTCEFDLPAALPADSEPLADHRRGGSPEFTALLATAIGNAQSRDELDASRRRIVTAADEARRQLERDLHDGAQQQVLTLAIELRNAQASVPADITGLSTSSWPASSTRSPSSKNSSGRSRAVSIRRSSPRAVSVRRCGRWLGARRSRCGSTSAPRRGCRRRSRWPPTTWCPRRSPMPPSTRAPPWWTSAWRNSARRAPDLDQGRRRRRRGP